jgi:hypothetical protein
MAHVFDPGYSAEPFASLAAGHPGPETYPPEHFRVEWGPVFHRGRLDGTARVLVIGQDPGAHECIVRRILVGEAGQRVQGFLAKLGVRTSYVMVNAFLYSVFGQHGGQAHADDELIAAHRNAWLDALLVGRRVEAVIALGALADQAFRAWQETPAGEATDVVYRRITHPTFPESASAAGQMTKADAMRQMLEGWNEALDVLRPAISHPEFPPVQDHYGEALVKDTDLAAIPEMDLPAGLPEWMRALDAWAARLGPNDEEKRATIVVRIPTALRPWEPLEGNDG